MNFTLAEWQQARRAKKDAGNLKLRLKECWSVSDNRAAFERALEDQGFMLAKGDRRGFVAFDTQGEVYSLSRWLGVKAKDLIASRMSEKLQSFLRETEDEARRQDEEFRRKKDILKQE